MKPLSIFTFCVLMALNGFSQEKPQTIDTSLEKTFVKVEIESSFPGGVAGWAAYLNENLHYPKAAIKKNIQGTVVVQFIVDKEGNITDIAAIAGPDELRAEAERVMKKSPKWIPAQQSGRKVKSYKKQPITFRLQ
ncbi:energy transducer TonB [Pinibacter aurantiacus]|uniref:Energy transducer TonB n=1 Tax=Pinibacter aurantiacus TaxID=2851599 RepID=A0A9E2SBI7_9BACT|nr:energy transducer TonB [Pinibacter aurantiacus]MBV4357395.1 energy transducer TonB [Pinibacter aurantiacus]